MRRLFMYVILLILMIFLVPILLTKKFDKVKEVVANEEKQEEAEYVYKSYGTIKLLHAATGQIEELPMDEYLLGVVSAEMPASYEQEALKAQAVVARTYTVYKIKNNAKHDGADICDDSKCCQAWISKDDRLAKWEENLRQEYWNKIEQAVYETKGKVITYNGKVIDAFFHSNSGGKTENVSTVWGGADLPYLQSVETAGESEYNQYASEVSFTKQEFENKMKQNHADFQINYDEPECIKVLEYTQGNRVKTIKIGNLNLSGVEVRTILGLRSANFEVALNQDNINFSVKGYGHGVGMSQTGANTLAKEGKMYEEIIKHFYSGVEINDI